MDVLWYVLNSIDKMSYICEIRYIKYIYVLGN